MTNTSELIALRFEDKVIGHLIGNFARLARYPLILAVHGPAGHGKSYQSSVLLEQWNVRTLFVSGSEMENSTAGGPAQLIRERYGEASQITSKEGVPCCILVDDIDAGIGDFGGKTSYTVNRQNVSSCLMNLADKPTVLEGAAVRRTPIIVTANRIDTLYEPLRRPGRMTSFYWEMKPEEIEAVVYELFSVFFEKGECRQLSKKYPGKSPAFFEQVRAEFISSEILETLNSENRPSLLRNLAISQSYRNTFIEQLKTLPQQQRDNFARCQLIAEQLSAQSKT